MLSTGPNPIPCPLLEGNGRRNKRERGSGKGWEKDRHMNKAETSPFLTGWNFYTDNKSISIPKIPPPLKRHYPTPKNVPKTIPTTPSGRIPPRFTRSSPSVTRFDPDPSVYPSKTRHVLKRAVVQINGIFYPTRVHTRARAYVQVHCQVQREYIYSCHTGY